MYDPVTARFMQEDSFTGDRNDPLSLNLYTYCHNEPLMYSDPTGHKDYKPGEATADYYREKNRGGNSTSYDRPQSTYPTLSRWDKWDTIAKKNGSAELLAIMSDRDKLNSIVGLCRQQVICEAKESGETLSSKQIDFKAEGKAIQAILMSGVEDPNSVGVTKVGICKVIGSALWGVIPGVAEANTKIIAFLPSTVEKAFFRTNNVDKFVDYLCVKQDNLFVIPGYVDEDAYKTGKKGGELEFQLITSYCAAKGIWDTISYLQNPSIFKPIQYSTATTNPDAPKIMEESGNAATGPTNKLVGTEFENFVEVKQLGSMNAKGLVQTQERFAVDGLGQNSVVPDYSLNDINGNLAAIADAKSGAIAYDDQAMGFIQVAARETTSKTLIYYTPLGDTPIPDALYAYAKEFDVKILQVGVK
jgi:hypothetical protein